LKFTTTDQIVVCGRKGSGKSTLVKELIRKTLSFIIFDYHHEHTALGYPTRDLNAIPLLWTKGAHRIVYLPKYRSLEELERLSAIAKLLRNLVLIVDECDRVIPKKISLNETGIGDLVHGGRHYGVGLITVTRRFADLHEGFISQADFIVFFSQHSAGDLERLQKEMGEEALEITKLPPYCFGEYDARENRISWFKKLPVPQ
jgi:DNA helicase HerA-like ATPase